MRKWGFLCGAIAAEVTGTLAMRASQDHPAWLIMVAVGYFTAFLMLSRVLRAGVPVGVAYGIWGAIGTALIAAIAAVIFDDPFTTPIVVGIAMIIAGVLMVEFGSHPKADAAP
ncbi:MAG: SMR family transporter [Mycobacterium sp.]